ncbi:MAG: histidine--tRNA ligase [Burkholderiaceae bacterium]
MSSKLSAVKGMNDLLPEQAELWELVEAKVSEVFRQYGYRPIRTPIVETTPVFVRAIGEVTDIVEKEMYSFNDALNGEALTLRPENTAAVVRAAIEHNLLYDGPRRLWYFGPMFRHERPQKGRYRQFHQFGVEALGFDQPEADAEQIFMVARLWKALGLRDGFAPKLQLNSLGMPQDRALHREALVHYFQSHQSRLDEDSQRRLGSNPLRILDSKNPEMAELIANAPQLPEFLGDQAREFQQRLLNLLNEQGIAFELNPRLVRGLDYYNLTVFEWVTDRLGAQGTVCGGGRYDSLVERMGGKPAAATGFAIGAERLILLVQEAQGLGSPSAPDAYLIHFGQGARESALKLAEQLRDQGLKVVLDPGQTSAKSQMKKADASGADLALLIGEDESLAGEVTVKPLRGQGQQATMPLSQLLATMDRRKQDNA